MDELIKYKSLLISIDHKPLIANIDEQSKNYGQASYLYQLSQRFAACNRFAHSQRGILVPSLGLDGFGGS
jgi:hypothetical protein